MKTSYKFAVGVGVSTLLFVNVLFLHQKQRHENTAQASVTSDAEAVCAHPAVVAAKDMQLKLMNVGSNSSISPNEPLVIATVNGQTITAAQLETTVSENYRKQHHLLAILPPDAPVHIRKALSQSVTQIRRETLDRIIDDQLLLQEAKRINRFISVETVRTSMEDIFNRIHQEPQTSDIRIQFQAFLCVNHLTESTFLTEPNVIRFYQQALTVDDLKKRDLVSLSPAQRQNPSLVTAKIASHVQQLRKAGKVQVFLPASFLW